MDQCAFNGENIFCWRIMDNTSLSSLLQQELLVSLLGALWASLKLGEHPCENGLLIFTGFCKFSPQLCLPLCYFSQQLTPFPFPAGRPLKCHRAYIKCIFKMWDNLYWASPDTSGAGQAMSVTTPGTLPRGFSSICANNSYFSSVSKSEAIKWRIKAHVPSSVITKSDQHLIISMI